MGKSAVKGLLYTCLVTATLTPVSRHCHSCLCRQSLSHRLHPDAAIRVGTSRIAGNRPDHSQLLDVCP